MRAVFVLWVRAPNPLGSSKVSAVARSHPLSLGRHCGNHNCVADGQSQKKVQVGPAQDARHLTVHLQHQLPVWNHHCFLFEEIWMVRRVFRLHHSQRDHVVCFHRWKMTRSYNNKRRNVIRGGSGTRDNLYSISSPCLMHPSSPICQQIETWRSRASIAVLITDTKLLGHLRGRPWACRGMEGRWVRDETSDITHFSSVQMI